MWIGNRPMPRQFDKFEASELHCPKCRVLRPVRERLLLILPSGELYAYRCVVCGEALGTREVKNAEPKAIIRATR